MGAWLTPLDNVVFFISNGVVAALIPLLIVPDMNRIYILPFSLLISTIASIVVCLRTPPEKDEVLESFSSTRFSHPFTGAVLQRHQFSHFPALLSIPGQPMMLPTVYSFSVLGRLLYLIP